MIFELFSGWVTEFSAIIGMALIVVAVVNLVGGKLLKRNDNK